MMYRRLGFKPAAEIAPDAPDGTPREVLWRSGPTDPSASEPILSTFLSACYRSGSDDPGERGGGQA